MRITISSLAIVLLMVSCVVQAVNVRQPVFARQPAHAANDLLRRADFTVVGASCLVCLRDVERLLRQHTGVVNSAISFKPPFKAVVIYYSGKTTAQQIVNSLSEKGYSATGLCDRSISAVPAVLLGTHDNSQPARAENIELSLPKTTMP